MNIFDFLISVLSGVAGSFLLVCIFFLLSRPKISIAKKISEESRSGRVLYGFKVKNNGFFKLYNVKINLIWICKKERYGFIFPESKIYEHGEIFKLDSFFKTQAEQTFVSEKFLRKNWNDDTCFLKIQVLSTHSISQLSNVVEHIFSVSDIMSGVYPPGQMEVVDINRIANKDN